MIKKNNKAFSVIEVMVWIFIFTMWIISIYSIIISTLKLNDYNKNYIIASNLAREQVELVRNIRDSNYSKVQVYNQINPSGSDYTDVFEYWKYYKIENNFLNSNNFFPVNVEEIINFWEWESEISTKMQNYRLCLNSDNLYTFNCSSTSTSTHFYRYIKIDRVEYNSWSSTQNIDDAFKLTSKVIWYYKWYHEFELTSIFTDYKIF